MFSREEASAWRRGGTEETSSWRGRNEEPEREERRVIEPRREREREARPAPRDDEGEQRVHSLCRQEDMHIGFQSVGLQ